MRNREVEEAATMMLESKGWIHESELPDLTYIKALIVEAVANPAIAIDTIDLIKKELEK